MPHSLFTQQSIDRFSLFLSGSRSLPGMTDEISFNILKKNSPDTPLAHQVIMADMWLKNSRLFTHQADVEQILRAFGGVSGYLTNVTHLLHFLCVRKNTHHEFCKKFSCQKCWCDLRGIKGAIIDIFILPQDHMTTCV